MTLITDSNIQMPRLINQMSFFQFVKPSHLWFAALIFSILAILLLTLTFLVLFKKKRTHFTEQAVKKSFELLISKAMLSDEDESTENLRIPSKIRRHIKNPIKRRYAIEALVNAKRSLRGVAGENITKLYLQLGFKKDSVKKFKSGTWHIKAEGIHELYMMDQHDMLVQIYKHTNSINEYVRMEAQTAVLHFSGFDGLRFLDVVSTPVSDWQQIKLLEQLKTITPTEMTDINKWLQSSNDTVVIFALKLAEIYQQFQAHDRAVAALSHKNEKVRIQAVKTLAKIADETTVIQLTEQYYKERFTNKLNILNNLASIASDEDINFLEAELDNSNDFLKIAAANVIAACCSNGIQLLKERATIAPHSYADIYRHIKFQAG